MLKMLILAGNLSFNTIPVKNQEVVLLNSEMNNIIEIGQSDTAGKFSFKLPGKYAGKKLNLLVRFKTDSIVSVFYEEVLISKGAAPKMIELNTKDLVTVKINFDFKKDAAPFGLSFFLDPYSIAGVPRSAITYLTTNKKTATSYYYNVLTKNNSLTLKIRKGSYKLGAGFSYDSDSSTLKNLSTSKALMNKQELKGDGIVGFQFEATQDAVINLTIEETE